MASQPLRPPPRIDLAVQVKGHPIFLWLVGEVGGFMETARVLRCSNSDLALMLTEKPKNAKWWGYPNPFPRLDEMTRILTGTDLGFLPHLCRRSSMRIIMQKIRYRRFGVENINPKFRPWRREWRAVLAACKTTGVSERHRKKWLRGWSYPLRLRKLDRLVSFLGFESWIEAVLSLDTRRLRHRVAPQAIASFINDHVRQIVEQGSAGYGSADVESSSADRRTGQLFSAVGSRIR